MALAISIYNGIAVCIGGGASDSILAPFLTEQERDEMQARREAQAQEAAQRAQIAKLKAWARRQGNG